MLERSYSAGHWQFLRVHLMTPATAATYSTCPVLMATTTPVQKRLPISFDSLNLMKLDNTEGMTLARVCPTATARWCSSRRQLP